MQHRKQTNKLIIFLLLILVLAVTLACGSSAPTAAPGGAGEAGETESPPAETYLGDTIEADGYALSAVSVADPAKPGMFYQAEAGKKLVAVEIIVSNISGDSLSVNPLNAVLLDTEGFTYQVELAGVDDQLATTNINPGEKVRGWVAFKIPEAAVPAKIKYTVGFFGGTEMVASLAQPPEGHTASGPSGQTETATELSYLGDAVEYFGYTMTPLTVADPAQPGMLYQAEAGKKLVAVEIILSNLSGDPLSVNPLSAVLVDAEGFTYQAELAGVDDQIDTLVILPGERIRGWVAYKVPEAAVPAAIKYAPDLWGEAFKAGLGQPPEGHTPVAEPTTAPPQELPKLGEAVQGNGFTMTVHGVQDPAQPGVLAKPKTGMRLVAVQIEIANQSGGALSVNPLNAVLVDADGFVYTPELGGVDDQIATLELGDGERVMGWVAFFIPETAQPAAVKYGDTFTGQMVKAGLSQ